MDNKETMLGRLMSVLASVPASMLGTLVDLVRKLSGDNGDQTHRMLKKMLRGELCESGQKWREQDGVIYFSVTSDGTTGPKWGKRLEKKDFNISSYAKDVLHSDDFKPTNGVTYEIAVLKGMLFNDDDRITKKICAKADRRKLTKPNAEVACLIRENFSDEEIEDMGLYWIVAMHEPIKDSGGGPSLLLADRFGGGRWLGAGWDGPGRRWYRDLGFAFVVSQVRT
jgi:hypothetical protein